MKRRTRQRRLRILTAIFGVGILAVVVALLAARQSVALPNTYNQSPTAFTFRYPDGWQYNIPIQNLLILAQPATFEGNEGPTFTVQRSTALADEGGLPQALDTYLRQGPLRPDRFWQQLGDIRSVSLDNRPALAIDLEGAETEDGAPAHARVVATQANNGLIYIFAINAPLDTWLADQATLEAILDSVHLLE